MKCIKCGNELEIVGYPNQTIDNSYTIVGYKCDICSNEWDLTKHIDTETWVIENMNANSVRITKLEDKVAALTKSLDELLTRLGV